MHGTVSGVFEMWMLSCPLAFPASRSDARSSVQYVVQVVDESSVTLTVHMAMAFFLTSVVWLL